MPLRSCKPDESRRAFTLVELLVSMTIVAVLLLMVSSILGYVQGAWRQASARVSQFREARRAFDRIVTTVGQATVNSYLAYRYDNPTNPLLPPAGKKGDNLTPLGYIRYSDLQFVCGPSYSTANPKLTGLPAEVSPGHAIFFQAPMGDDYSLNSTVYRLPTALRGLGFFVKFGSDEAYRPDFLATRGKPPSYRYRLHEYRAPTQATLPNYVIQEADMASDKRSRSDWYGKLDDWSRPIANNIVLLLISPRQPVSPGSKANAYDIAPEYTYDTYPAGGLTAKQESEQKRSDFQLPPMVEVTMVALDEGSAELLALDSGENSKPHLADYIDSKWFHKVEDRAKELAALQEALAAKKISFRVFNATVPIRASRWSQDTTTP